MRRCLVVVVVAACTQHHHGPGGGGGGFEAPALAPIVVASLPASLQPGGTTPQPRLAPTPDPPATLEMLAAQYVRNLFQDSYNSPAGGQFAQGYINDLLVGIDARLAFPGMGPDVPCLHATPSSFTADLSSAIDPTVKITLGDLQCSSAFGANGDGSGMVFGSDGSGNYSLWVALGAMNSSSFATNGGFLTYANVANYGSTSTTAPEIVDGMILAYTPTTYGGFASRFKANATAKTFELFYASNGADLKGTGTSDGSAYLAAGFRMISDGTLIYADGILLDFNNMAAGWQPFTACIAASTLTVDPTAGDCTTLASSFTLGTSASLDYCELVGAGAGCTIPLPVPQQQQMQLGASQIAAIAAVFPITAAPSGVTKYGN